MGMTRTLNASFLRGQESVKCVHGRCKYSITHGLQYLSGNLHLEIYHQERDIIIITALSMRGTYVCTLPFLLFP